MQYRALLAITVAVGCGSKDRATDPAPGSATGSASAPASPAPAPSAPAAAAAMTDEQLRAAPLDACAAFSAADVEKHMGYKPEKVEPKTARDITTSAGALDLRDAGCEWVNADTTGLSVTVFLQLYRSEEEATRRMTGRVADDEALPDLGTDAFTSKSPKGSVVIYMRDRNRNYTVTASALKGFDPADAKKRLVALLAAKF